MSSPGALPAGRRRSSGNDSSPNRSEGESFRQADISLTPDELQRLADRLLARGISKVSADTAEQSRDFKITSRAIRVLPTELDKVVSDKVAAIANDVAHNLTHLRVMTFFDSGLPCDLLIHT